MSRSGPAGSVRPPVHRLVLLELRKSVDTRAGRWLLVVLVLLALAVAALQLTTAPGLERTVDGSFLAQQGTVTLLLPVVGILLATSEWSTRSVMTTFTLVPQRQRTTTAKIGAGVLLALGSVLVNLVVAALATAVVDLLGPDGVDRWDLRWALVAQSTLLEVVMVLGGIGIGLALLSSPLAIVLYFLLPLLLSVLIESVSAVRGPAGWVDLNETFWRLVEPDLTGGDWAKLATSVALWCLLPLAVGSARVARREPS